MAQKIAYIYSSGSVSERNDLGPEYGNVLNQSYWGVNDVEKLIKLPIYTNQQSPAYQAPTATPTPSPTPTYSYSAPAAPQPVVTQPAKTQRTLIDIANSRPDVLNTAKAQGGDPYTAGTAANTWLNNWWNTAGKNEYANVTLTQPAAPAPVAPKTSTPQPPAGSTPPGSTAPQNNEGIIAAINAMANTDQNSEANAFSNSGIDYTRKASDLIASLTASLNKASTEAAARPKLVDVYAQKRAELNISPLEDSLAAMDAELKQLDATYSSSQEGIEQQRKSMTQINRTKNEVTLAYDAKKRDLVAQRNGIATQLSNKYSVLGTMVDLTGKDYDNAKQDYDTKFSQTISTMNLLQGLDESQKNDVQRAQDNAKANIQMIQNLLKEGNASYASLPESTRLSIKNMEVQAGLPAGFTSFVSSVVKNPVVSYLSEYTDTSGRRIVPVATRDASGKVTIQNIDIGQAKDTSDTTKDKELLTTTQISKLAVAGVPKEVALDIQSSLQEGYDLETIRRHLATQYGQEVGYGYLDRFMVEMQKAPQVVSFN